MRMTSFLKSSTNGSLGSSSEAVAEGARRATGETASQEAARRDPEVAAIARRRKFSGSEKQRLLAEAERCKEAGTLGAFLRRERISSSMIASWRKQVGVADQTALAPKKRGPKPDPSARQIQQLERDNARLRQLTPHVGLSSACQAFALNRGFVYRDRARRHGIASRCVPRARPRPPLALSGSERELLLGLLDSERFADVAPAAVFTILLDEGRYHGSIRTMYRLLAAHSQTGERRRQRIHPLYAKPELLATRPNQVWSWDITKLKGPAKWTCFHLYVILDIYSRYVVGWLIAHRESAELAEQLIADTLDKEDIAPGTLTLHAERGTSMRSKPVAALLIDLEAAKTHSRPHVSDDNPYSEAQFKTLKYRPDFPIASARSRTRALTASGSFIGTTTSTATAESALLLRPPFTMAPPRRWMRNVAPPSI